MSFRGKIQCEAVLALMIRPSGKSLSTELWVLLRLRLRLRLGFRLTSLALAVLSSD